MAIRRMISRDPAEFRAFQSRMTTVGKIRLGLFETPEGRRGRPVKLGTFRLTADNEALIRAVAEEYGGEAEQWTPQGAKAPQWQVITDAYALEVYVVNGQNIDPVYEAWAGGRTCVRRCDGEWEQIKQEPCLCTGPNRPQDSRELCKITVRVQVMLKRIQGLGSWLLESHGENAAMELSTFREFIAGAPMPVPAMLRLRKETRRQWNAEKGKFDTLDFYVPWLDVSVVNAATIAIGGDALTQALSAGGAPSAIGGTAQAAIEARPVSAPVPAPAVFDIDALRPVILADIETQTTIEGLDAIRTKLKAKGVDDKPVIDAWLSKSAAVMASLRISGEAEVDRMNAAAIASAMPRPYRVLVTGSRTWDDVETLYAALDVELAAHPDMVLVIGMCPDGADHHADVWAQGNGVTVDPYPADWSTGRGAGFARNLVMVASGIDRVFSFNRGGSKGTEHCTRAAEAAGLDVVRYVDDTPVVRQAPERIAKGIENRVVVEDVPRVLPFPSEAEMAAAGSSCCGGFRVTDVDPEMWSPCTPCPVMDARNAAPVEGTVEAAPGRVALPDVPAGDYDAAELYTMLMTGASQQTPPLTTSEVNGLITRTLGVDSAQHASGYQLARLRAGLKAGTVTWR